MLGLGSASVRIPHCFRNLVVEMEDQGETRENGSLGNPNFRRGDSESEFEMCTDAEEMKCSPFRTESVKTA